MSNKKIIIIIILLIIITLIYLIMFIDKDKTSYNNTNKINKQEDKLVESNLQKENVTNQVDNIIINKKDITNIAKFYKYKSGDVDMEVIAVKAYDGSIRTALNTCQVCYDSGRGYYKQQGNYLICQNCGNKFNIDQIEKIKGGCNPVPILEENKIYNEDTIIIQKEYLDNQQNFFRSWK